MSTYGVQPNNKRRATMFGFESEDGPCRMLRAGLIGFPSAGKTALFQLLTSAREAPRAGGKSEANVGVSRVPDDRLDKLTALFHPKKHTPATVEFADIAGMGGAKTGAAAL